jgi:hypothetical protein
VKGGIPMSKKNRWQNIWFLTRFEMVRIGWSYFWSVFIYSYAAVMVTLFVHDDGGTNIFNSASKNIVIDFYFLTFLAISGYTMKDRYLWKNKKLSDQRTNDYGEQNCSLCN